MTYELIKVSELPELTTPSDPNVIPIQDGDYLKRISFENLKEAVTEDVADDLAAEVTAREGAVSGEATARGNADTAILADLASPYSASATYAVGDYCIKDGQLYRCTTAISTAEAWTAAHWSAVALGDDTRDLRSALCASFNDITTGTYSPSMAVGDYDIVSGALVPKDRKYYIRSAYPVHLQPNDKVTLNVLSGFCYYINVKYDDSNSVISLGKKTALFTVVKSGEYWFVVGANPIDTSVVYNSPSDIGTRIVIRNVHSVYDNINNANAKISNLEDSFSPTEVMENNYQLINGRMYDYYGRIKEGGKLIVDAIPANTRIALQGYSDPEYTHKVIEVPWITSVPVSMDITSDLYMLGIIVDYNYGQITDPTIQEDLSVKHQYSMEGKINGVENELSKYNLLESSTTISIAHRGDYVTAPQCTKPAYILACKKGFKYAENDINITADSRIVMWHETNLERLGLLYDLSGYEVYTDNNTFYYYDTAESKLYTYNGDYVESSVSLSSLTRCNGEDYAVSSLNFADIRRFDFGRYAGNQYKGTQILTFAEWVLLCKKLGLKLYIDTKITYTNSILADLVNIIKHYGMAFNVTWININNAAETDQIRSYDEHSKILALVTPTQQNVSDLSAYANDNFGFAPNGKTLTSTQAALALENGFLLEAYYVDYANTAIYDVYKKINSLLEMGVQGLTLDGIRIEDAIYNMYLI